MKRVPRVALAAVTLALLVCPVPVGWNPVLAQEAPESGLSKEEKKQRAKEERIAEYLRKKEEKRAGRAQGMKSPAGDDAARARELETKQLAEDSQPVVVPAAAAQTQPTAAEPQPTSVEPSEDEATGAAAAAAAAAATGTAVAKAEKKKKKKKGAVDPDAEEELPPLPQGLARAQNNVRSSTLGQNPTIVGYLDMVDRQAASPQQLAALGNFLAESGMHRDALEYYLVAIQLDENDPVIWNNLGSLHLQLGELSPAESAFGRCLTVDPNYAMAHYNLGAVYDEMGKYEDAIEAYKHALTLDPTLGDPTINPQALNNRRLTAVKLMLYREQSGSLGMPMIEVPGGALPEPDEND